MKTFRVWVRQFGEDNTPFGDLARDIADDSEFPKKNDQNACLACELTFEKAWSDYDSLQ
jgi:uncharacterized protein YozE (UPF0346 family)